MLRSPFNGGAWQVPPDAAPEFVEALLARGFTRIESEPAVVTPKLVKHKHAVRVSDVEDK